VGDLRAGEEAGLQVLDLEARVVQEPVRGPVEVAAAGGELLQTVAAVLPTRDPGLGAQAVLEEVEPPGRRMRLISRSARAGSGTVQRVKVESAASTDASGSAMSWPSRPTNSTATGDESMRAAANFRPTAEGSTARTFSTSGGYTGTLSPDPNPISSTVPWRPATARARWRRTSWLASIASVSRGST
jgi:cell division septation protein DedD